MSKSVQYKIFVRTGSYGYDEYKVYSHELTNNCLVLNLGHLKNGGPNELGIPISSIHEYHTGELDE